MTLKVEPYGICSLSMRNVFFRDSRILIVKGLKATNADSEQ